MSKDKYCVYGNPIEHSLSPIIHAEFALQCQQNIEYGKQLVRVEEFHSCAEAFFASGGKGLNVTAPLKQEAWAMAEQLTARAQIAGAVNTLWLDEQGSLHGDNTDGAGLVGDIIERNGWEINSKNILLLGAGGAARGVILPLLAENPESLTIVNRTLAKAKDLARLFSEFGNIGACAYGELGTQKSDLIINATSASISSELPPLPSTIFKQESAVYDMVYGARPTNFLCWCEQQGVTRRADGLGMLVGQAAESFFIWRGVRPMIKPVIDMLRHR